MKVGIFAADERMIYLCELLKKEYEIIMIDEDDTISELNQIAKCLDALVFPAWGIDDTGFVRMKQRGVYVLEMMTNLRDNCVIFSGQESPLFQGLVQKVYYWLNDEEVAVENAQLTAQGILGYLLINTNKSIQQMKVDLIGTGRCAKACAAYLDCLHIPYRMVSRKNKELPGFVSIEKWITQDPCDIIVNTAPACLVHRGVMDHWKNRKYVIDIASGFPFVDDVCKQHPYLDLVQLKAIPSQIASSAAAEIISHYLLKELKQ